MGSESTEPTKFQKAVSELAETESDFLKNMLSLQKEMGDYLTTKTTNKKLTLFINEAKPTLDGIVETAKALSAEFEKIKAPSTDTDILAAIETNKLSLENAILNSLESLSKWPSILTKIQKDEKTYTDFLEKFKEKLKGTSEKTLTVESYLTGPTYRLMKYEPLFESILKKSNKENYDGTSISGILESIKEKTAEINEKQPETGGPEFKEKKHSEGDQIVPTGNTEKASPEEIKRVRKEIEDAKKEEKAKEKEEALSKFNDFSEKQQKEKPRLKNLAEKVLMDLGNKMPVITIAGALKKNNAKKMEGIEKTAMGLLEELNKLLKTHPDHEALYERKTGAIDLIIELFDAIKNKKLVNAKKKTEDLQEILKTIQTPVVEPQPLRPVSPPRRRPPPPPALKPNTGQPPEQPSAKKGPPILPKPKPPITTPSSVPVTANKPVLSLMPVQGNTENEQQPTSVRERVEKLNEFWEKRKKP